MKFDINMYDGKYAMHCETEEETRAFCDYLHRQGKRWTDGTSYAVETNYSTYKENTCYEFLHGKFGRLSWFNDHDYTVLEFSDFTWDEYRHKPSFRVFKTDTAIIDDFLSGFQLT